MQLTGPVEFFQIALALFRSHFGRSWQQGLQQALRRFRNPVGLRFVGAKALRQPLHHGRAHILRALALNQVVQRAMAKGALGHLHLVDLQQIKDRLQHGQSPANDGFSVFFDAVQAQVVWRLRLDQPVFQPTQSFAGDFFFWPARCGQHIGHSPDRARGAVASVPMASVEQNLGFVQHRFGRDFGGLERRQRPSPFGKKLHRPRHAAHPIRLEGAGVFLLSQNHFGGASANVHHQAALGRLGQEVRDPQINQPRFFFARNHLDGETQNAFRFGEKNIAVARFAQSLCGHRPHMAGPKAGKAFTKTRQAIPAALHGLFGQVALGIQSIALPHSFFDVFHPAQLARIHLTDFEPETVGTQINGGVERLGLHGQQGSKRRGQNER